MQCVIINSVGDPVREFNTDELLGRHSEVTIGRSSSCVISLKRSAGVDTSVGRVHLKITEQKGDCWVEDVGSRNGIFKNGERVERSRLEQGDEVRFGNCALLYGNADTTAGYVLVWDPATGPRSHQFLRQGVNTVGRAPDNHVLIQDQSEHRHAGQIVVSGKSFRWQQFEQPHRSGNKPSVAREVEVRPNTPFLIGPTPALIVEKSRLNEALMADPITVKGTGKRNLAIGAIAAVVVILVVLGLLMVLL